MSRVAGRGEADVVRSEEELEVGVTEQPAGAVRAAKRVETEHVSELVERGIEHADVERSAAVEGDSGQIETLADGSISIPVFEEQLVVEKRLVVRERIVIRKHTVVEQELVEADLQKERVDVEADDAVRGRVEGA